jgi:type I restriction enzyme M protein
VELKFEPPKGNANFAWVQHIVNHLAPAGAVGFVLANGSMSSNQCGEGEIRDRSTFRWRREA